MEKTNHFDEAEQLYRRALEIRRSKLGPTHPDTGQSLHNLASFLKKTDRFEEGEPLHKKAIEILRTALGDDHPTTKKITENYEIFKANRDTP